MLPWFAINAITYLNCILYNYNVFNLNTLGILFID